MNVSGWLADFSSLHDRRVPIMPTSNLTTRINLFEKIRSSDTPSNYNWLGSFSPRPMGMKLKVSVDRQGTLEVSNLITTRGDHACRAEELLSQLKDAITSGDKESVFALAKELVGKAISAQAADDVATDDDKLFETARRHFQQGVAASAATLREQDKWLTPAEAARYANVSRMTIWRWRNELGLKFSQVGGVVRIRLSDLLKFLEGHMQG